MQEILPQLRFTQAIRRGVIVLRKTRHRTDVRLHGAVGVAAKPEVFDHALAECGQAILSGKGREDQIGHRPRDQQRGKYNLNSRSPSAAGGLSSTRWSLAAAIRLSLFNQTASAATGAVSYNSSLGSGYAKALK